MLKFSRNGASLLAKAFGVGRIVIKWGLVAVAKSSKASCYKSIPMKRPLYAALDLHSAYSVLGSMDHSGKTQPRMRFATEAERLRAQVSALKQKRRPVHLTMEAGALTRSSQWDRAAVGRAADHLRAAAQSADPFQSDQV